jgi:hypothetical protein
LVIAGPLACTDLPTPRPAPPLSARIIGRKFEWRFKLRDECNLNAKAEIRRVNAD